MRNYMQNKSIQGHLFLTPAIFPPSFSIQFLNKIVDIAPTY